MRALPTECIRIAEPSPGLLAARQDARQAGSVGVLAEGPELLTGGIRACSVSGHGHGHGQQLGVKVLSGIVTRASRRTTRLISTPAARKEALHHPRGAVLPETEADGCLCHETPVEKLVERP
jgi:hypothetical protein